MNFWPLCCGEHYRKSSHRAGPPDHCPTCCSCIDPRAEVEEMQTQARAVATKYGL